MAADALYFDALDRRPVAMALLALGQRRQQQILAFSRFVRGVAAQAGCIASEFPLDLVTAMIELRRREVVALEADWIYLEALEQRIALCI